MPVLEMLLKANPGSLSSKPIFNSPSKTFPFCLLDEEDNLFVPPKLTDEDFSPFGSRGGLFSGGKGLFDDDDEEVSPW